MSLIDDITRETWIKKTFPEWGTWLVEEIEEKEVPAGNVSMWWLGCVGIWMKTPANTNITIDLWTGNGKRTHGNGKMAVGHQMANMSGARKMQPNLRNVPFVFDPFAFRHVDAVLATHYHHDHMSEEWAAHVIHSGMTTTDENGKEIPVPGIGEIMGGSQREDSYEKLAARMQELGMNLSQYDFYLDLRKYGTTRHAGYGLGFERCVMYLTGMQIIRDVLPFPRTVGNCEL